ncbi:kinase-like protein [Mycena floridula]|nr:kinase-like protein [Mycena floridula]
MLTADQSSADVDVALSSASLASLSRNASVISTSSSDSGVSLGSPTAIILPRPRPIRTFSSPRASSPQSPVTRGSRPPSYLTKELGVSPDTKDTLRAASKARSKSRGRNVCIDDFKVGETLGDGSYSTVMHVTLISTGKVFAAKVLDKAYLVKKQKMSVALVERTALLRLASGHPGIIRLHYSFQDEWSLYFIIDLAVNGEMQSLLKRMGSLNIPCAQYYGAQIVDAVDYMHKKGVIHRDLKPENLLLDESFRIKITDFGTAKIVGSDMQVEKFVGTAQYVAPELVEANETSESSDLWALGCIVYQMVAGRFAFQGLSEYLTLQKVKQMDYSFPDGFDASAKDFVQSLLVRDPTRRLGAPGANSDTNGLRSHPFFAQTKWDSLWTDPPPNLEAGLVKNDPAAGGQQWDDVGAAWDRLVGDDREDEIEWASDAAQHPQNGRPADIRRASGSSSSEGSSPVEDLATELETFSFSDRKESQEGKPPSVSHSERERGRTQALTPVQGHGPAIELTSALKLADNETVLCRSDVEVRSLRRRASRLIPIPVPPIKPKNRELILTTRRLFCVKYKSPEILNIKTELSLRSDRPKDTISTVELKGEREFVVLTSSKAYHYATRDRETALTWVQKIDATLKIASDAQT